MNKGSIFEIEVWLDSSPFQRAHNKSAARCGYRAIMGKKQGVRHCWCDSSPKKVARKRLLYSTNRNQRQRNDFEFVVTSPLEDTIKTDDQEMMNSLE